MRWSQGSGVVVPNGVGSWYPGGMTVPGLMPEGSEVSSPGGIFSPSTTAWLPVVVLGSVGGAGRKLANPLTAKASSSHRLSWMGLWANTTSGLGTALGVVSVGSTTSRARVRNIVGPPKVSGGQRRNGIPSAIGVSWSSSSSTKWTWSESRPRYPSPTSLAGAWASPPSRNLTTTCFGGLLATAPRI